MSEQEMLQRIVNGLRDAFDVKKVVLFGSRARHDALPDSDFDLLVVVNSDMPYRRRQGHAYCSVYDECPYPIDLIVLTPDELDRSASVAYSVVKAALREGEVLYAA